MITKLVRVTILVSDQDEPLNWYIEKLGFEKKADTAFGSGARWLTVAPKNQEELEIVLQKPNISLHGKKGARELMKRIGEGTTWVLETDDCRKEVKEKGGLVEEFD